MVTQKPRKKKKTTRRKTGGEQQKGTKVQRSTFSHIYSCCHRQTTAAAAKKWHRAVKKSSNTQNVLVNGAGAYLQFIYLVRTRQGSAGSHYTGRGNIIKINLHSSCEIEYFVETLLRFCDNFKTCYDRGDFVIVGVAILTSAP